MRCVTSAAGTVSAPASYSGSAPSPRAKFQHPQRCLPRCEAARQKARPAQARVRDGVPSVRTMRPACTTESPAASRRCVARAVPLRRTKWRPGQSDQQQAWLQPQPMRDCNPNRKKPRRMERGTALRPAKGSRLLGGSNCIAPQINRKDLCGQAYQRAAHVDHRLQMECLRKEVG